MKKISPDIYAEAFVAALQNEDATTSLVEKFIESIRRHNDWSRRHQIIAACEKKWRKVEGKSLVTVESARELSRGQREKLVYQFKNKNCDIESRINQSLIAGVKIVIDGERQLDGSLRRKLNKLFS